MDICSSVNSSALVSRKRRELEAIIDTSLNAVFVKQLQVLRENALSQFKASLSSEEVGFKKVWRLFLLHEM
jgi:hypothetical protein